MEKSMLSLGFVLVFSVVSQVARSSFLQELPGYYQWQSYLHTHAQYENSVKEMLDKNGAFHHGINDVDNVINTSKMKETSHLLSNKLETSAQPAETTKTESENLDIIYDQINNKSGLKEILKQVILNRLLEQKRENELQQNLVLQYPKESFHKEESFLDKLSNIFSKDTEESDSFYGNEEVDRVGNGRIVDANTLLKEALTDYIDQESNSKEIQDFYDQESNSDEVYDSFLDTEFKEVQAETADLIEELQNILKVLEEDSNNDQLIMAKAEKIIKNKLRTMSIPDLIRDKEFRNSIFHRFAVLKLPLREEDISIAEVSAVRKVVKNNIESAMSETKSLLTELKKDVNDVNVNNLNERSDRLHNARKQLQKLLDLTQI